MCSRGITGAQHWVNFCLRNVNVYLKDLPAFIIENSSRHSFASKQSEYPTTADLLGFPSTMSIREVEHADERSSVSSRAAITATEPVELLQCFVRQVSKCLRYRGGLAL
jgi:hypothetical protein